jgi:hypothetical protein
VTAFTQHRREQCEYLELACAGSRDMSKDSDDEDALDTILTRTQRLMQMDVDPGNSAFHSAQLLLSEYIVMLADTQLENRRLRSLLGSYGIRRPAVRNLSASKVIAGLQNRLRQLETTVSSMRAALEKIRSCESAKRNPGEIAARALRKLEKSKPGDASPGRVRDISTP